MLLREFVHFLLHEKRWWLLPMLAMAVAFALVLLVTSGMGGGSYRYDIY